MNKVTAIENSRKDRVINSNLIDGVINVVRFDNSANRFPHDTLVALTGICQVEEIEEWRKRDPSLFETLPQKVINITSQLEKINVRWNSLLSKWEMREDMDTQYGLPITNHALEDIKYWGLKAELGDPTLTRAEIYLCHFSNRHARGITPHYVKAVITSRRENLNEITTDYNTYSGQSYTNEGGSFLADALTRRISGMNILPGLLVSPDVSQSIFKK